MLYSACFVSGGLVLSLSPLVVGLFLFFLILLSQIHGLRSIDLKSMQAENSRNVVPPTSRSSNCIALRFCNFPSETTVRMSINNFTFINIPLFIWMFSFFNYLSLKCYYVLSPLRLACLFPCDVIDTVLLFSYSCTCCSTKRGIPLQLSCTPGKVILYC